MKHISHPIIGYANHGRGRTDIFTRVSAKGGAFASTELNFSHPITGEAQHLRAALEDSYLQVLSLFQCRVSDS